MHLTLLHLSSDHILCSLLSQKCNSNYLLILLNEIYIQMYCNLINIWFNLSIEYIEKNISSIIHNCDLWTESILLTFLILKCLLLTTYIETSLYYTNDIISIYFIENNIIYIFSSSYHSCNLITTTIQ